MKNDFPPVCDFKIIISDDKLLINLAWPYEKGPPTLYEH